MIEKYCLDEKQHVSYSVFFLSFAYLMNNRVRCQRFHGVTLKSYKLHTKCESEAARTGNPCTLCVEYICDTYDARCGLNLQADPGYIANYTKS